MDGVKGFLAGGIASIVAGSTTHPLDLIKVRMQLHGESPSPSFYNLPRQIQINHFYHHHNHLVLYNNNPPLPPVARFNNNPISVGVKIFRTEGGAFALFSGISGTVLRQGLYSTTSIGLYDFFKHKYYTASSNTDIHRMPLPYKIAAGLFSGCIGATIGNPADVAMIRMQADGRLPHSHRRNYKSAIHAICQISKQEGITSLWRGSSLTVNRAMIVTASQLATYDQLKETILQHEAMKDGLGLHVTASLCAGFVAAVASNPVDVIKTRVMNMKVVPGRALPYQGALDCALKTVRSEGFKALYKGFVPILSRQGPFTVILFVTLEQVRNLLNHF